jgi:hypothetical protein
MILVLSQYNLYHHRLPLFPELFRAGHIMEASNTIALPIFFINKLLCFMTAGLRGAMPFSNGTALCLRMRSLEWKIRIKALCGDSNGLKEAVR